MGPRMKQSCLRLLLKCWQALKDKHLKSVKRHHSSIEVTDLYLVGKGAISMRCNINMRNIFSLTLRAQAQIEENWGNLIRTMLSIQVLTHWATYQTKAGQALRVAARRRTVCHQVTRISKSIQIFCTLNASTTQFIKMRTATKTWAIWMGACWEVLDRILPSACFLKHLLPTHLMALHWTRLSIERCRRRNKAYLDFRAVLSWEVNFAKISTFPWTLC